MDQVTLSHTAADVGADELAEFFDGWPRPPSLARRVEILTAADEIVIARTSDGSFAGFITAITDRSFAAYIPLLEVRRDLRGQGIGSRLVTAMLERLRSCYVIDLVCDDDVVPFYERLGGSRLNAMAWRNHDALRR